MAENVSEEFALSITSKQYGLRVLMKSAPLRRALNSSLRKVLPIPNKKSNVPVVVSSQLEQTSEHFNEHRWAFIENVFADNFHQSFKANFPLRRYLEPVSQRDKSYDAIALNIKNKSSFGPYPELVDLFTYLMSEEFEKRVSKFAGSDDLKSSGSLVVTQSWPGTFLAPHQDGASKNEKVTSNLNFVFFVDGGTRENAGGLVLSKDNELDDVIFSPRNLVNTCLVYDILAPFFHGFLPVTFGKSRKAVIMNWKSVEK